MYCVGAGALSDMPAVQAFAMYAGMSLLINFVLQMTLFVSLFSLDVMREEVSLARLVCTTGELWFSTKKFYSSSSSSSSSILLTKYK